MTMNAYVNAALAVIVVASSALRADAQGNPLLARRLPVTVALVDHNRFGGANVLVRRVGSAYPNVIVLAAGNATPKQFMSAAIVMTALMERDGDVAPRDVVVAVPDSAGGPQKGLAASARVLQRLRAASEVNIPGVGKARTVVIYLADATERQRLRRVGKASFRTRP